MLTTSKHLDENSRRAQTKLWTPVLDEKIYGFPACPPLFEIQLSIEHPKRGA